MLNNLINIAAGLNSIFSAEKREERVKKLETEYQIISDQGYN